MQHRITKIWFDSEKMWMETDNGWVASTMLRMWTGLKNATMEQLNRYQLSYTGIHWNELDEDLCFEGLFHDAGFCALTPTEDSIIYTPV